MRWQAVARRRQQCAQYQLYINQKGVILSGIALATVCVTIALGFYDNDFAEVVDCARAVYLPEMDVEDSKWTTEDIKKYMEEFLHSWVIYPGLGESDTIGMPRFRFIYTEEGSCPSSRRGCYGSIDFDRDTFAQVRREKVWLRSNNLHPQCLANMSAETLEPRYVDDAEVDDTLSESCFGCYYPPNGHVMDIPKANLTLETLVRYERRCVKRIARNIRDLYLDQSAQFVQFELLVHNVQTDLYVLISPAFERSYGNNWWPTLKFNAVYIRGMLSRGNYHGFGDDVQMLILPVLVSILIILISKNVLELIQITQHSFMHYLKLFLCLLIMLLCIIRIYLGIQAIFHFEEVLDIACPAHQCMLSQENRTAFMRSFQGHLPTQNFFMYNRILNTITSLITLILFFQFMIYDDYFLWELTRNIKCLRLLMQRSYPVLVYYLVFLAMWAVVGNIIFGRYLKDFIDWPTSFFTLVYISKKNMWKVVSESELSLEWIYMFIYVLLTLNLYSKFIMNCFHLREEIEEKHELETIGEEILDEQETKTLSPENEQMLIMLYEYLNSQE